MSTNCHISVAADVLEMLVFEYKVDRYPIGGRLHGSTVGSRGSRVGRRSRLAGPGPDEPGGAGSVAGPAVRHGRRPVRRAAGVLGPAVVRTAAGPGRADGGGAGRDRRSSGR